MDTYVVDVYLPFYYAMVYIDNFWANFLEAGEVESKIKDGG